MENRKKLKKRQKIKKRRNPKKGKRNRRKELEAWDKTYGILPQLNNILRKLERGDLDNAIVKLEALLEHLNELLTDPDGPFYGDEEAEALLEEVIDEVENIYMHGTACTVFNETTYLQIIYFDEPDFPVILRYWTIEPVVTYHDFLIECEEELLDLPECAYEKLTPYDIDWIIDVLEPCE